MKRSILLYASLFSLFLPTLIGAQSIGEKVIKPESWLIDSTKKWAYVGTLSAAQAFSGAVEAHRFRQTEDLHIISNSNYHAFETLRDISLVGAGYTAYANLRGDKPLWRKGARLLGGAMLARNVKEWAYKGCRYGNPFDYTEEHNKHALVYINTQGDAYIGLGPVSGPTVDIICTAVGVWLLHF